MASPLKCAVEWSSGGGQGGDAGGGGLGEVAAIEREVEVKKRAASKSHCESERRRRQRINAHYDALRALLPRNEKVDKATLLAEAIKQLGVLKKQASDASKGLLIPSDSDHLLIDEPHNSAWITASICCDYEPELIDHLRQALASHRLSIVKAEIATLANRMRAVFAFSREAVGHDVSEGCETSLAEDVYKALRCAVEKGVLADERNPRRMRVAAQD